MQYCMHKNITYLVNTAKRIHNSLYFCLNLSCIMMYIIGGLNAFICWNCAFIIPLSIWACLCACTLIHTYMKPPQQRVLLEQKQKKKRQEPLMVQSNVDGRSRTRRTKQSEEQAPLVESYLSSNSSTIYHGKQDQRSSTALLIQKTQEEIFVLGLKTFYSYAVLVSSPT